MPLQLNGLSAVAGVGLALACTAWLSGTVPLLALPVQLVAGALGAWLSVLWHYGKLWVAASLLALSVIYCFFLEGVLARLANQRLHTVDADGNPTGTLAAPLQAADIEVQLLRCRLSVRRLKFNPKLLDDTLLDPALSWTPLRTRAIEVAELSLKWSLHQSPRLVLQLDGLHVSTYGQWVDDACLVRSFRAARQSLWGWVDAISAHDRARVVQPAGHGDGQPPEPTEIRSWCNCTGQLLTIGGPGRWFHRRGSAYDLCGAMYDELADGAEGKGRFVRVLAPSDLGTESDSCCYRVARSHGHAQFACPTPPQPPPPPASTLASNVMKLLAENSSFSMTDARFSYAQMSMMGCPIGMQSEYVPADQRNEAGRSEPECELHGLMCRVGRLWLGPNERAVLQDEQREWSQQWSQLQPPAAIQLNGSNDRIAFDPRELKRFKRSGQASMETADVVGRQEGGLEDFTIHLLGGAEKRRDLNQAPSMRAFRPHVERRHGPHYDGDTQDRNLRSPMLVLNSTFTFFRTGTSLFPIGEIHRIECPTSTVRLKVSTQDAAIMTPIAARMMQYKAHADANLSTGSMSLRPHLSGFAVVKQELSSLERWQWAFKCVVRTLREERCDLSWDTVQHQCSIRKAHLNIWKQHVYKEIQLATGENGRPGKIQIEKDLAELRGQASDLENNFECDQCIMYRRIAWLHVMSELECSTTRPCALAHGREKMIELISNSNQWVYDFGWMCPDSCHCHCVEYELCFAQEDRKETWSVDEYQEIVGSVPLAARQPDCYAFGSRANASVVLRVRVQHEGRLPEARFRVTDGSAEIRRAGISYKIATLRPVGSRPAASGSWICGSVFATSPDPTQLILCVSDVHIVYDPTVGQHLAQIAQSFAPFGALSARLPPQTPKPPVPRPPGSCAPALAGGKVEADQLELAETYQHAVFLVEMDKVRVDFPTDAHSADSLTLCIDHVQMQVGIPSLEDGQDWCNGEHAAFGRWPGKQLYSRAHLCLERFRVDATQGKSRISIIQPGTLDVVVDSCLLRSQSKLPNHKVRMDIDRLAVAISPRSFVCAVQAIDHMVTHHEQMAAAAAATKKAQEQARWNGNTLPSGLLIGRTKRPEEIRRTREPEQRESICEDNTTSSRLSDDSGDEDITIPHSGHEKIQHPTCFLLIEVSNCSTYTLELRDYVCSAGQVTTEVPGQIDHQQKGHWTCAQRGKLKGNIGCAVFAINSEKDSVHVELLLIWSVPFVGEDTACAAIGRAGQFTYMHAAEYNRVKQQRELCKLMKRYTGPNHAANSVHTGSLGDFQIISSLGRAPLKFWVVHRQHLESVREVLAPPPDYSKVKKRRRNLRCNIVNRTQHFLEVIKCVYGKMEGECTIAIDPVVPPGGESHWLSSANRLTHGNCGCVIFSIGGTAELLVQWYVPNGGSRVLDSIVSHNGAFSKIPEYRLQKQLEKGPAVKSNFANFNVHNGLRVKHELRKKRHAQFTLSSTEPEPEPEPEPVPEPEPEPLRDSRNAVLHDYQRLSLKFSLPKITFALIEHNEPHLRRASYQAPRQVQLGINFACLTLLQSEHAGTKVDASIRSLFVKDTFYRGSDMYLVSSRVFGSTDDFFHATCDVDAKYHPVMKVRATSSPVTVSYTSSTLQYLMGLSRSLQAARHASATSTRTASVDSSATAGFDATAEATSEDASAPGPAPVVDFELLTAPITITVRSSKLNPLIQLMVNSMDLTFVRCGDTAHTSTTIDMAIYYHNMELSAWEPCVEWSSFKLDRQINGHRSMTSVFSDDTINFNVTTELMVDLISLQLDATMEVDDVVPTNDAIDDSMLFVHNKCGVPISFNVMNAGVHSDHHTTGNSTSSVHPSNPDHEGWVKVWDTYIENDVAVAVSREHMQLDTKPQTFDPSAWGRRGELSANHVLIRVDKNHHRQDSDHEGSTEWRPLRPQSLSTCGSFLQRLEPTDCTHTGQEDATSNRPLIRLVVGRENGAHKLIVESAVQITNDLPVDLRMQLTDGSDSEKEELNLPRRCGSVPIPLHLVDRRIRFQKKHDDISREADPEFKERSPLDEDGWKWTGYIRPGDAKADSIVLMSPDECLAYCMYMDMTRGPETCHIVLHCPLIFENLLPCTMWITLAQQETKTGSKNQIVVFERFRLEKGARYTPPYVDVRFGMAISVELEDSPDTEGCNLDQFGHKQQATVWPNNKADRSLTLLDAKKRKLHASLDYNHQPGKPTIVSLYVSHWIINETGLHLKYFDCSSGSIAKPANYENRPKRTPVPFMYSVKNGQAGKLGVGLTGGKIDHTAVPLNHAELCTTLEVNTPVKKGSPTACARHRILCHVTNGEGRFSRIKLVHLRHLLHFENRTPHMIAIKATAGDLPAVVVPANGGMVPFSWPKDDALPKQCQLFYDHAECFDDGVAARQLASLQHFQWTSKFEVCEQDGTVRITEFWLKVAREQNVYRVLRAEVTIDPTSSRAIVVLREEAEHPYMIENHLHCKIGFRQLDSNAGSDRENLQELKPRHFHPFLWDSPLSTQRLECIINEEQFVFDIDDVGSVKDYGGVHGEVILRGSTRTLILKPSGGGHAKQTCANDQGDTFDILDNNVFEVRLHSVGFSVINNAGSIPAELLYSFFDGIHFHAGKSSAKSAVELKVADWQIADHTTVIESGSVIFGRAHSHLSIDSHDAETVSGTRDHIHVSVIRDLKNSSDMCDAYSSIMVGIWPCEIDLQEDVLVRVYSHLNSMHKKLVDDCPKYFQVAKSDTRASTAQSDRASIYGGPASQVQGVRMIYCGELQIHPIVLTVTFRLKPNGVEVNQSVLPEWAQSLGVAFHHIDRAPLSFKAVKTTNHFERSSSFLDIIKYNYWTQVLTGSYRVLGAADFRGNPTHLLGNLADAVGDEFYLPAHGLVTSPTDVLDGFAKGTESLVEHSLMGVRESLSSITDPTSKVVAAVLENGVGALACGLLSGNEGVVLQPIAGLREHGLPSLLLGIERGLVGTVAKPSTSEAVLTARIPRSFKHGRLVAPYSHAWAAEEATTARPTAMLCITMHRLIFPEVVAGAALWPGPLCATISTGAGSTAYATSTAQEGALNVYADEATGVASWQSSGRRSGHAFAPIHVELEDHALPPPFDVLTVTVTSTPQTGSQRSRNESGAQPAPPPVGNDELKLPIAQFDVVLPGLGLEERWRRAAQRPRAQAIHIHNIDPSLLQKSEDEAADTNGESDDVHEADGQAATARSTAAATSTSDDAVRLLTHASWERVGLHTTPAPAFSEGRDRESTSPLPSPISSTDTAKCYETALARPQVGDGCFIDIGLSLVSPDSAAPRHGSARSLPRRRRGASGS